MRPSCGVWSIGFSRNDVSSPINLILLDPKELEDGSHVILSGVRGRHIRDILRKRKGEGIRVGLIDGPKGRATITNAKGDRICLHCEMDEGLPLRPPIDLLLAIPRPKVLKRLLPQIAALGVDRLLLTNAWKVERNYFDTHLLRDDILRGLLIEGLQQAGDTRLPRVSVHTRLRKLVEDDLEGMDLSGSRIVMHPAAASTIDGIVGQGSARLLLAVGPEGGWIDDEIDLLQRHRFQPWSMGNRILRSDTACIAALALAHAAFPQSFFNPELTPKGVG